MIEKRTIVERVEILRDGTVQVRLAKLIVEDGVIITEPKWHRTLIEPGVSVEDTMAEVNRHLAEMGEAGCADFKMVSDHAAVAHTPATVAKFAAMKNAEAERQRAIAATEKIA